MVLERHVVAERDVDDPLAVGRKVREPVAPRPLVVGPGVDDGPEYSPDGRQVAFVSYRLKR